MNIWNECKRVPLPELLSFVVDNRGKTVPINDSGTHKLIATNCIRNKNWYTSYEKIRYLSEETYRTWFRAHPVPGDIIFVCKGTPGKTCMVPNPIDFCIAQDMIAFRVNENLIYNRYLLAILRSREIQEQITNTSVGDVIPHFKKQFLDQLLIPVPPMDIQRKIGDLYFAIALKEELNKKINKNLQIQAQIIFNKYFIEPHNPHIGWTEGCLTDIADYLNGLAMQKFRPESDSNSLPVLKIKELRQGMCDSDSDRCSLEIKPEYIIHDGDVIFSWSGSLMVDFWCGGDCGLNQHLFKVSSDKYGKWFYYSWTLYHLQEFIRMAADRATTMGHIKRDALEKARVLIPSHEDYIKIENLLQPLYDSIIIHRIANRKLANICDTLLPKLMSGELDVSILNL